MPGSAVARKCSRTPPAGPDRTVWRRGVAVRSRGELRWQPSQVRAGSDKKKRSGSGRGRRPMGAWLTPRADVLSVRGAVAHPCATCAMPPWDGVLGCRRGRGFDRNARARVARAVNAQRSRRAGLAPLLFNGRGLDTAGKAAGQAPLYGTAVVIGPSTVSAEERRIDPDGRRRRGRHGVSRQWAMEGPRHRVRTGRPAAGTAKPRACRGSRRSGGA